MTEHPPHNTSWDANDASSATMISRTLRLGLVLSTTLIAIGFALGMFFGWERSLTGSTAAAAPATDVSAVVENLLTGRPAGVAQLGLLALMATPVLRLIVAAGTFAMQRDWIYVLVSCAVLAILLVSLIVLKG